MSVKNKIILALSLLIASSAQAEFVFLPDNHHQQFQSYGLFFEQQSTLVLRQEGRAWGAIAATLALFEEDQWIFKPQLVLHGSANASFKFNSHGDMLLTETIDARVGLSLDLQFSESWRGFIMWTHQSGHISDNVPDPDLIGSNLGNEVIDFRVIHDIDQSFRLGGGIRPVVGSDPGMIAFGAEQFAEWFPWGAQPNPRKLSPYIATGFEEYGRRAIQLTFNAQIGLATGSHFLPQRYPAIRIVLGYYNGNDPRMKYFQMKYSRVEFFYGGLMFDI